MGAGVDMDVCVNLWMCVLIYGCVCWLNGGGIQVEWTSIQIGCSGLRNVFVGRLSTSRSLCVAVCYSVLQCVAVCCSVLQCVAVCCSVLQCVAVCCSVLQCNAVCCKVLQCVAVVCSLCWWIDRLLLGLFVLQSVAECCRELQSVAVCCSVMHCTAVCGSVWQYVAVCYNCLCHVLLGRLSDPSSLHDAECCTARCSVLQCIAPCARRSIVCS